jgi:hypothetical protein
MLVSIRTFQDLVNDERDWVAGRAAAGPLELRFCVLVFFFFWRDICFSPRFLATKKPTRGRPLAGENGALRPSV